MPAGYRKPGTYIPSLAVGSPFIPVQRSPFISFSRAASPGQFRRPNFSGAVQPYVQNRIRTAGQAQFMRNAEDQDRAKLGLPQPSTVDIPEGLNINFGPFARRKINFPEFREVDENEGNMGGYETAPAAKGLTIGGHPYIDNYLLKPTPYGTPTPSGYEFPTPQKQQSQRQQELARMEQEAKETGKIVYTDPDTGLRRLVSKNEAATLEALNEQRLERELDPEAAARARGRALYTNPFTGEQEEVSPAESKIRQYRDDNEIKKQAKERYPETYRAFEKLSDDELLDLLLNPTALGEIPATEAVRLAESELRSKGFSPAAIEALKERAKRQAASKAFDFAQYLSGGAVSGTP